MTRPVSVVLPALFDPELFERGLPPLLEELEHRATGDEVVVVDDTGRDEISAWMAERFPTVRVLLRPENGGFAPALLDGVRSARHELVLSLNPDVVVRPGFLEPLVDALEDPEVHSVVPRILLEGDEERTESLAELEQRAGLVVVDQPGLEGRGEELSDRTRPVAYAVGGACLLRRDEFVDGDGFDPLFAPFYWEDVDLGWSAWRAGKRVLHVPASVVEHHHRGTIKSRVAQRLVRAAIEKNRLLFQWKHLEDPDEIREHVAAVHRWAIDAWLGDEREELIWLAMALHQLEEAQASRRALPPSKRTFGEIRAATKLEE